MLSSYNHHRLKVYISTATKIKNIYQNQHKINHELQKKLKLQLLQEDDKMKGSNTEESLKE